MRELVLGIGVSTNVDVRFRVGLGPELKIDEGFSVCVRVARSRVSRTDSICRESVHQPDG